MRRFHHLALALSLALSAATLAATPPPAFEAAAAGAAQAAGPLVQPSDLVFEGTIKVPSGANLRYVNSGHGVAYNPSRNSLYVSNYDSAISEISIPTPSPSALRSDWPVAQLLGAPVKPIGGLKVGQTMIGGLLMDGSDLLANVYSLYSGSGTPNAAHYRINTQSWQASAPTVLGDADFLAGAMAEVPDPWQGLLGGDTLTGLCCTSIISRTSHGPSAAAFTRADVGVRNSASTTLVRYPDGHETLGDWNEDNALWNNATDKPGLVFVDSSLLAFGRYGADYCYGDAGPCGDPSSGNKGDHAYPYNYTVWRYAASDLAAVAAGTVQPWDLVPTRWFFDMPFPSEGKSIRGAAWDEANRRLFLTEEKVDGSWAVIRVFRIAGAPTQPRPVDCRVVDYGPPYPISDTEQQRDPICEDGTPAHGGAPGDPLIEPIPDSDGDGVNDYVDVCPGTPPLAGVGISPSGCYEPIAPPSYVAEINAVTAASAAQVAAWQDFHAKQSAVATAVGPVAVATAFAESMVSMAALETAIAAHHAAIAELIQKIGGGGP